MTDAAGDAAHPRLYFTAAELARLRDQRVGGAPAAIWRNLLHDARRCAQWPVATEWIAPLADDPVYENLYDRFWAMMSDAAAIEQLAFTVAYGADTLLEAALARLLAACARWRPEADLRPDYGTAYATTRIVKAIAIGYDLLFEALSPTEIGTVLDMLGSCGARLATDWFGRPDVSGPVAADAGHHSPHHASVEWSAFGILALCVLDDLSAAPAWLAAAVRMFGSHLIPGALVPDGSAAEGAEFWASTVTSQLQFLDPLRRSGGPDLLAEVAHSLDLSMGLAVYRPHREVTAAGEPVYGPSTALSAALACLARERRDPALLTLATAEPTTGRLETFPARTPHRSEQLRVAPGGYAYAWYPCDLEPGPPPSRRSWHFPAAGAAYLRTGWGAEDLSVTVHGARVTVCAGPHLVYQDLEPRESVDVERSRAIGTGAYSTDPAGFADRVVRVDDDGSVAAVACVGVEPAQAARVVLDRRTRQVEVERTEPADRTWIANPASRVEIHGVRGRVVPGAAKPWPVMRVGYGLLDVLVTDPRLYPTVTSRPVDGRTTIRILAGARRGAPRRPTA